MFCEKRGDWDLNPDILSEISSLVDFETDAVPSCAIPAIRVTCVPLINPMHPKNIAKKPCLLNVLFPEGFSSQEKGSFKCFFPYEFRA